MTAIGKLLLPRVKPRVTFTITVLVFQCLTGQAPTYLAAYLRRPQGFLAAAGPRLWNMLPIHLRLCDSLGQFKRFLKTHLFGVWERCFVTPLLGALCINHLTYLLTYLLTPHHTRCGLLPRVTCSVCLVTGNVCLSRPSIAYLKDYNFKT